MQPNGLAGGSAGGSSSGGHSSMESDDGPSPAPQLPVDVLRMVLLKLLPPVGVELPDYHAVLGVYASFSQVCKTFLAAARSTPLKLNLAEKAMLPRAGRTWLCKHAVHELWLHSDFPTEKVLCSPDFIARSASVLQTLSGAQVPYDRYRALPLWRFTSLRTLELNAEAMALNEGRAQRFDVRQLAELTQLTSLSLQQFAEVQNLYRLPPSLEQLTLHVFELPRLLLPTHLCRLRELTVSSRELGVDLAALCGLVSERLLLEAAVVALQKAPLPAEEPGEGGHADLTAVPRLVGAAMEGGVVAALELVGKRVEALDDAGEVAASLDVLELAQVLQAEFFTSFGCFINPDDIEEDEELELYDALRVSLVRHEHGQPLALGFTFDLDERQQDFLLAPTTQVWRLALESIEPSKAAEVLSSEAFYQSSGATLRQLHGCDIHPQLTLPRYSHLEELDAFLPDTELLEYLPPSLLRLFLCALSAEQLDDGTPAVWPPFAAGVLSRRCPRLQQLSLSHFSEADLTALPPSVTQILIENLELGEREPPDDLQPVRLRLLPPPPGAKRVLKLHFLPSEALVAIEQPAVELEQLLCSTEAGVLASAVSDPPPGGLLLPITLTIRAPQHTLEEVMQAVTASPLKTISFQARRVVFQGAGGARASSRALQLFIRQCWGHAWRVIPLEQDFWSPDGSYDEDLEEDAEAAEAAGELHFESFELRRIVRPCGEEG